MPVVVVPFDPVWSRRYQPVAAVVADALASSAVTVHHIGSTAVPGMWAKPIIDALVELTSLADADARSAAMAQAGFEVMGEYGISGRRYYRRSDDAGAREVHVHAFEVGAPEIVRHLAFRDYLRAHPEEARRYSDLKRRLVREHSGESGAYVDGKDALVNELTRRALWWRRTR